MQDTERMQRQIEWARTLNSKHLSENDQKIILSFLLFFNLFEAKLFGEKRELTYKRLKAFCEKLNGESWFNVSKYDRVGDFFAKRYIGEGDVPTVHFYNLQLHSSIKGEIQELLTLFKKRDLDYCHSDKLMWCYLSIAYRFRNNLFHGKKDPLGLNKYTECFKIINDMMYDLLHDVAGNNIEEFYQKF